MSPESNVVRYDSRGRRLVAVWHRRQAASTRPAEFITRKEAQLLVKEGFAHTFSHGRNLRMVHDYFPTMERQSSAAPGLSLIMNILFGSRVARETAAAWA